MRSRRFVMSRISQFSIKQFEIVLDNILIEMLNIKETHCYFFHIIKSSTTHYIFLEWRQRGNILVQ